MIIAVEGIDGAGKNTLATALEEGLLAEEIPVARIAFPRYDNSLFAQVAADALRGQAGDLVNSIYGMATVFAADRAEVAADIASLDEDGYVVIIDRWVASNAAYSAARAGWDAQGDPAVQPEIAWIDDLEYGRMGLSEPDLQILLATQPDLAAVRVVGRAAEDSSRDVDAYEADLHLQHRTFEAYRALAAAQWHSPWYVIDPQTVAESAQQLVAAIVELLAEEAACD